MVGVVLIALEISSRILEVNEEDPIRKGLVLLHQRLDDLVLVAALLNGARLEELCPRGALLGLVVAYLDVQDSVVHVLVGCQHTDQLPTVLRRGVLPLEQANQRVELVLVLGDGEPGHLLWLEVDLLVNLRELRQVFEDVVVVHVLQNAGLVLPRRILVELNELVALKLAVLVFVVAVEEARDAVVCG